MRLDQIPPWLTTMACGLLLLLQVQGEAFVGVTRNRVKAKLCRGRVETKGGNGQGRAEMVEFIAWESCACVMHPPQSRSEPPKS